MINRLKQLVFTFILLVNLTNSFSQVDKSIYSLPDNRRITFNQEPPVLENTNLIVDKTNLQSFTTAKNLDGTTEFFLFYYYKTGARKNSITIYDKNYNLINTANQLGAKDTLLNYITRYAFVLPIYRNTFGDFVMHYYSSNYSDTACPGCLKLLEFQNVSQLFNANTFGNNLGNYQINDQITFFNSPKNWMISRSLIDSLLLIRFNDSLNKVVSTRKEKFPQFSSYKGEINQRNQRSLFKSNNSNSLIVLTSNKSINDDIWFEYDLMELDTLNSKLKFIRHLYRGSLIKAGLQMDPGLDYYYSTDEQVVFAPNDSLAYIFENQGLKRKLIQVDLFADSNNIIVLDSTINSNPISDYYYLSQPLNGKLYLFPMFGTTMSTIWYPDIKGKDCNLIKNQNTIRIGANYKKGGLNPFEFIHEYTQRTIPKHKFIQLHNCNSVKPLLVSDTNYYTKFIWYLHSDSLGNGIDSIIGKMIPDIKLIQNEKRFIKVKAINETTGYYQWYSDTIRWIMPPKVNYYSNSQQGCQYAAFNFYDSCIYDTVKAGQLKFWHWYFGDGTDTLVKGSIGNISHIYNKTGMFNVKLVFSNGFCIDSISKLNAVNIIDAPKPIFDFDPKIICSRNDLTLKNYIHDTLSSRIVYSWGDGDSSVYLPPFNSTSVKHNYTKTGNFTITQSLNGISGCISTYSKSVKVIEGLNLFDTIQVYYTTVLDSTSTHTVWKSLPYAVKYQINSKLTTDTFYIDHAANPAQKSQAYYVRGVDTCGNQSATSLVAQTIYLKATNSPYNEYALLEYAPYLTWKDGVLNYRIQYFNEATQQWLLLSTAPPNLFTYQANVLPATNGILNLSPEICYRIIATEQNGNQQISTSNEACIPVYPVAFIPNAFSPNHDGINEYFKPITAGLSTYLFEIYDRWGTLVYTDTPESKGWDGSFMGAPAEAGTYVYRLSAAGYLKSPATNDARLVERKGTLVLIR